MTKIFLILFCGLGTLATRAQLTQPGISARAMGMGAVSSCSNDEWSLFNNIGGLSKVNAITAGFTYESRPALIGANSMAFVVAAPTKVGVAGIGLFKFGDVLYSEQTITAGYSNTFGIASLGVRINYIQYRAEGFGSKGLFSISAGGITQLTRTLFIGVHVVNLNQPKIGSDHGEEHLATLLIAGLGTKAAEKVWIVVEVEKDLDYRANLKAGIEYQAHKKLFFRTGFNIEPGAGFFGIGFKPKRFSLDYAYRYEPNVGSSHEATVGYVIRSK